MCLALPAEVMAIDGETATVSVDGVAMPVSLALLDTVSVGDFVIVHVGFALTKIDPEAARRQLDAMANENSVAAE